MGLDLHIEKKAFKDAAAEVSKALSERAKDVSDRVFDYKLKVQKLVSIGNLDTAVVGHPGCVLGRRSEETSSEPEDF